jgi:hypothetical protein
MRIQHLPPERVPRSGVFKGSFILLRSSVAQTLFCSTLDSITVPKYKKSSTPSTMTALHVVLPPPAPRHVNISLCQAFALALMPFPMTSPAHEHVHTPLHHRTQTHNFDGFFALPHGATSLAACCPSGLFLSRRHVSSHTPLLTTPPFHDVCIFRAFIVLLSLPALQLL